MKQLFLLIISLGSIYGANAMDSNFYGDKNTEKINPKSIVEMAKMPVKVAVVINAWAEKNKEFLHAIIPTKENTALTGQEAYIELCKSKMAFDKVGIPLPMQQVKSKAFGLVEIPKKHSYVFPIEVGDKKYWVQATGPFHKIHNLESYNGKGWNMPLERGKDKVTGTLQTASRALNALVAQEVIRNKGIATFHIPNTYVAQLPGRPDINQGAYDESTFVVQEDRGPDWVSLRDNVKYVARLSPQVIEEAYSVVKTAVLWDINGNSYVNTHNWHLGQSDLEQPNNQSPTNFGYSQEGYKLEHDKALALVGLANLFNKALSNGYDVNEQCILLKGLVEQDPDVVSFNDSGLRKQILDSVTFEKLN